MRGGIACTTVVWGSVLGSTGATWAAQVVSLEYMSQVGRVLAMGQCDLLAWACVCARVLRGCILCDERLVWHLAFADSLPSVLCAELCDLWAASVAGERANRGLTGRGSLLRFTSMPHTRVRDALVLLSQRQPSSGRVRPSTDMHQDGRRGWRQPCGRSSTRKGCCRASDTKVAVRRPTRHAVDALRPSGLCCAESSRSCGARNILPWATSILKSRFLLRAQQLLGCMRQLTRAHSALLGRHYGTSTCRAPEHLMTCVLMTVCQHLFRSHTLSRSGSARVPRATACVT